MTMHVNLSAEMDSYIKAKVASGFYGNATEVIRDAIRRMQEEESRVAAWQAAIAKGNAQLDRGEGAPYTPELMERLTQSATRELIRADERRQAEEQLEAQLLEGLGSAESELTTEDWCAIRKEALARIEARKLPR